MADITYDDRMTPGDAMLWNIERDPMLRSTIISVQLISGLPDEDRMENMLNGAVHKIPRLRQRVMEDPEGIAPPLWVDDPYFDPSYHIREINCPGEGSLRDLLDVAAPISQQAFDKDRPLWELYIVKGMADGKVGLIMKLHHAVGDGMGLVKMTESLVETNATHERNTYGPWKTDNPLPTKDELTALAKEARREETTKLIGSVVKTLTDGITSIISDPAGTVSSAGKVVDSVVRGFAAAPESRSAALSKKGMVNRFDVVEVPVDELKRAGKAAGGTINDAFVGAIAYGMAGYLAAIGEDDVTALSMSMPINIRDESNDGHAANHFVPSRFDIPLDIDDAAERMRVIHELVDGARNEPAMPLTEFMNAILARMGPESNANLAGGMMKTIDIITSNVPGPPFEVYSSGAKIEAMFPFGPLGGSAINFTLFSYDGTCYIGINADTTAVTDPVLLTQFIEKGFADVCSIA